MMIMPRLSILKSANCQEVRREDPMSVFAKILLKKSLAPMVLV